MKHSPGAILSLPYLRLHQAIYERTGGRIGRHAGGNPALLLTTTGRRTGAKRRSALIYATRGEDLVVVASDGGADNHPGWFWNLEHDPSVQVQIGTRQFSATARIAQGQEREELWKLANANNRGLAPLLRPGARGRYDAYQRHTDREIPVVVITPD